MRAALLLGSATILVPINATAQSIPVEGSPITASQRQERLESGTNQSQDGIVKPAIGLLASSTSSDVVLTIAKNSNGVIKDGGQSFLSLTLKAPLDDDAGEGTFITEQGVTNKIDGELGLTFVLGTPGDVATADADAIEKVFEENCRVNTENSSGYLEKKLELQKQVDNGIIEDNGIEFGLRAYRVDKCEISQSIFRRSPALLRANLSVGQLRILSNSLDHWRNTAVKIINLTGGAGYGKFDYLNPVGFGEQSAKRISYHASASFGINPSATAPFFAIGYQYREDYKDAAKRVICPALSGGSTVECKNSSFAPPKRDIDNTIFGLVRTANLFGLIQDAKWGTVPIVEFKAAYDIHDKIFGVSMPIYLFLDKNKEFKGGVRVSWEEKGADADKDQLKFAVFVTKSFDFLGF